jgi:outer membrane lipoprotein-sorting protein
MNRTLTRWIPAIVAPALVGATVIGISISAHAEVTLPAKSASEILQFINTNPNLAFSGNVTKTANLGLPDINLIPNISQAMVTQMQKSLPKGMSDFIPKATAQDGVTEALGFLAGTQKATIYVDGIHKARVQILDPMSERDFIVNGSDLWYYNAGTQTVSHHALTAAELAMENTKPTFDTSKLPFDITSPASVANYFLTQADASTTFTVDPAATIAGRSAYQLTMTPKTSGTLVDSIDLYIDGVTGLPLDVRVKAVGQSSPAFEVGFNSITYATPDASIFNFTPPAGSTVSEVATPTPLTSATDNPQTPTAADQAKFNKLKAEGWAAVVQIPASEVPAQLSSLINSNSMFAALTKPVDGGRVFSTALLNILFTNDGRIFAGSVTTQKLLEAAAE